MTEAQAIYIPADHRKPLRLVSYPSSGMDLASMQDYVFSGVEDAGHRMIDVRTIGQGEDDGVILTDVFDDEGLYNTPLGINLRIMMVYHLVGICDFTQFSVPLVGNHLLLFETQDSEGETTGVNPPPGLFEDMSSFLPGPTASINGEVIHSGWSGF